ncbi:hypothetical protein HPB51_028911 [Rhipicephalus microplus]|uniref:DUF7041 domain-containing protein n=1 Tax=Rhipicephalus microplus TaxID=6941 RepID=A0A9J6CWJ5_RHIMP|nr:hypothetical protein HPB51_028911 [Rhipicephalus microplus]
MMTVHGSTLVHYIHGTVVQPSLNIAITKEVALSEFNVTTISGQIALKSRALLLCATLRARWNSCYCSHRRNRSIADSQKEGIGRASPRRHHRGGLRTRVVKAHFRLWQITSQQARYWHLVSCLPPDVADDLADILATTHPSHPYDTLKTAIISRKSESEHSRLQQLITATELGDRRPSQLLRRMRQLLGGPTAPPPQEEKVLRELFL